MENPEENKSYYNEFQYSKKANEFFIIILMDLVKKLFELGMAQDDIHEVLPFTVTGINNILKGKEKEVGNELLQFAILCGSSILKDPETETTSLTLH